MGFDVSAGILIILGPTVWPLCMGQDFRLRITADELANGPSPKKEMAIGEVVKPFLCVLPSPSHCLDRNLNDQKTRRYF